MENSFFFFGSHLFLHLGNMSTLAKGCTDKQLILINIFLSSSRLLQINPESTLVCFTTSLKSFTVQTGKVM